MIKDIDIGIQPIGGILYYLNDNDSMYPYKYKWYKTTNRIEINRNLKHNVCFYIHIT